MKAEWGAQPCFMALFIVCLKSATKLGSVSYQLVHDSPSVPGSTLARYSAAYLALSGSESGQLLCLSDSPQGPLIFRSSQFSTLQTPSIRKVAIIPLPLLFAHPVVAQLMTFRYPHQSSGVFLVKVSEYPRRDK